MKYEEVEEGEWVQPKARGYRQACCDCGLVHIWDFRIRDGALEYRVRRNDRATAAIRRGMKRKAEKAYLEKLREVIEADEDQ